MNLDRFIDERGRERVRIDTGLAIALATLISEDPVPTITMATDLNSVEDPLERLEIETATAETTEALDAIVAQQGSDAERFRARLRRCIEAAVTGGAEPDRVELSATTEELTAVMHSLNRTRAHLLTRGDNGFTIGAGQSGGIFMGEADDEDANLEQLLASHGDNRSAMLSMLLGASVSVLAGALLT